MDHQETYLKNLEGVVTDVAKVDQDEDLIHLSSGVVLKRVPFSRMVLVSIMRNFKEPPVPKFYNEDKERWEENPNHPDYAKALDAHNLDVTFALLDVGITLGTKLHSLPKDFENPAGDGWVTTFKGLGFTVPDEPRLRYLMWVKNVACLTEKDTEAIADKVLSVFGTREATVEQAINTFPRDEIGESDRED